MLDLRLLGQPQITLGDKPVTQFVSSKAQALLFYLAVMGRPYAGMDITGATGVTAVQREALFSLGAVEAGGTASLR